MKERLKAYRLRQIRINALEEKLERLISLAEKSTTTFSLNGGSTNNGNDKLSTQVVEIMELKEQIEKYIAEEKEELNECEEALKTLPDNQRTVMELYFLHGKKWAEVAKIVGYTEDYCWQLQYNALKKLKQHK